MTEEGSDLKVLNTHWLRAMPLNDLNQSAGEAPSGTNNFYLCLYTLHFAR